MNPTPILTITSLIERLAEVGLETTCMSTQHDPEREIEAPHLHRPGLALVGHFFHHHPERIQVFGETELSYLESQSVEHRSKILDQWANEGIVACVVTKGQAPVAELLETCENHRIPLLQSSDNTGNFIRQASRVLGDLLAPTTVLHGVMVDVFGVGILIMGPSGIGKSECALELVMRGHRLVADDMVEVKLRPREGLICRSMEIIKHHMEIRGLGIINVQDLFGVASVRDQKRLELVISLETWNQQTEYDRLGTESALQRNILDVQIDELRMPVRPGRTLSEIIEIAARNRILKIRGVDSAQRFQEKLIDEIAKASPTTPPGNKSVLDDGSE